MPVEVTRWPPTLLHARFCEGPRGQFPRSTHLVVLCNGSKVEAESIKEEIYSFLKEKLKLNLSKEKTKITHLNDGFTFLGFQIQRKVGSKGMGTKVLVPRKAVDNVLMKITHATDKTTQRDSVETKIQGLNKIISGWCRYYQYTSEASTTYNKIDHQIFWKVAHWLGRKYKLTIPSVLRRFNKNGLGNKKKLVQAYKFTTQRYKKRFLKSNPYTMQEVVRREELPTGTYWTGWERRPGMADLRPLILARDNFTCQRCRKETSPAEAHVDHKRPVRRFKRPSDANVESNLQTLCITCHKEKTKSDRQMESRVR